MQKIKELGLVVWGGCNDVSCPEARELVECVSGALHEIEGDFGPLAEKFFAQDEVIAQLLARQGLGAENGAEFDMVELQAMFAAELARGEHD